MCRDIGSIGRLFWCYFDKITVVRLTVKKMEADLEHGREATVSRSFASDEGSSDVLVRKNSMRYRKKNASLLQETEIDGKAWKQGTGTGPEIEVGESGESSTGSTIAIESPLKAKLEASVYYDEVQGVWKCHHCSWVCPVLKPGVELIDNHKEHCQRLNKTQALVGQGFPLEHAIQECSRANLCPVKGGREIENENTDLLEDKTMPKVLEITDGGQGAPENAGIQQHQPGNSLSEPVLQNSQNAFVREQDETQPRNHSTRTLEKCISTGNVEDEVVRVLKEQQSHDLLCPVCGSCITKRVILRKRKRTSPAFVDKTKVNALVPASEEDQNDQPETQNEESEDQNDQPETQNEDSEETETYGCLSCFSLFVRRVTGVPYSSTKVGSQSSSKMSQDPGKIVDKEKESIHCLLFLYPGSKKKEPESGPESPQMEIEHEVGVSASKLENGDDLDATITPAGRLSMGPAIHNTIPPTQEVSTALVTIPGTKIVAEAAKDKTPSADRTDDIQEVWEMPTADSGAGNPLHHAYSPSKHDVGLDAPSQLNKQHLDQPDVERREEKLPELPVNDSASVDIESVEPSIESDMACTETETGTQEEIQNELVRHDNLPNVPRKDTSAKLDEPNKGSYLCNCIPVSIQSIWSGWPLKETTKDEHLNEPLLHNDRGKESSDKEASIVANHGKLQPDTGSQLSDAHRSEKKLLQESGHGVSSSTSEEQDRPLLAKSKDSITIINVQEVSAASGAHHVPLEPENGRAQWDILKSIVYGGLNVSLTSFGVVSSAAGGEAKTLTVIAIGLANMVAGLFMLLNSILDLRDQFTNTIGHNFWFNGSVAVFSYLIFGSLAPITYGFSFQKSDNRNYKFFTTSAVSLVSITLLALGKARVAEDTTPRPLGEARVAEDTTPRPLGEARVAEDTTAWRYFRTVSLYLITGFCTSIIGYLSGEYIEKLLEKWGFKTDDGNTHKLFYY